MVEREEVRSIVSEVLEEEHLHNFTKIFEREHNLFRGSHDKMPVPPSVTESYYTRTDVDLMTHWRKDEVADVYYDDGYFGAGVLTKGSVLFVGDDGKVIQDNTKAYWHDATKQLNIGDYDISIVDDFEDNFEDNSIGATWTAHNTDANRTIVEAGITLTIAIAASTDGRWVNTINEAPKLYKAASSPPFEFIVKMPAQSLTNNNTEYGAFIGYYDATQTNGKPAYKFTNIKAGDGSRYVQVNRIHGVADSPPTEVGSDQYLVMDEDAALWFKIKVDVDEAVTFWVSDDSGSSWFQMEKSSVAYEWTGFFASDMQIGLVATTMSSTNAAITAQLDGVTIDHQGHNSVIAERFKLTDTDLSHLLKLRWNEDDSVDRTLSLKVRGGNRTLDLYENFAIGNGYDVTITALGQANAFTMNEDFTIGDGSAGTLTYSAVSKTLTVEDNTQVNQDLTTDAVAVQFHSVLLSGSGAYCKIDSSTTAIFIADAHDADAYTEYQEDGVLKWTAGYDYSDGKYKISEGVPGTNLRLEIVAGGSISVYDSGAAFLQIFAESSGTSRLIARSYADDAYVELKEQATLKWCAGFDYTDSLAYVISEGAPGTNNRLKIASGGAVTIGGTLGCGELTVNSGTGKAITIKGTSTGNTNLAWIGFYESDGTTRKGYIGDSSSSDENICLRAEAGDLKLLAAGTVILPTGSTIGNLTLADGSITDSGGAISFGNENLSTTGTLGSGAFTLTQNSDTLALSHDGSSAYIKWSDGDLALMTDEGTDTNTYVSILGKGTGFGILEVYDTDEDSYVTLTWKADDQPSITCDATPTEFNFLHDRAVDIKCWSSITSGNPYFYIYGHGTAANEYLRMRVEPDNDALIEAEHDLNIIAGGGNISFGDENLSTTGSFSASNTPTKTTATWSKSIGSGGDYATFALMMAAMPDLLSHAATVTIEAGITLSEQCEIRNKHAIDRAGSITIQAEKYFPTSGDIPTADSATATTLRDAALATAALGNDYFNGCWMFIVDGTGTDNGFIPITDYVDATGDVIVSSWTGTEPDNTSRYIIVGALIDGGGSIARNLFVENCTVQIYMIGVGMTGANTYGAHLSYASFVNLDYCGICDSDQAGIFALQGLRFNALHCGIVNCNTDSSSNRAGIVCGSMSYSFILKCGISDNNNYGIRFSGGNNAGVANCFGDANGTWGTYLQSVGQAEFTGTECSGSLGNHFYEIDNLNPGGDICTTGNIGIGSTTFGSNASQVVLVETGTPPGSSIANAFQMYSADVGGVADEAGAHFRDELGLLTILGGGGAVLDKTSGKGIKVDTTTPTFGWRDLLGQIRTRGVGSDDPNDATYNGNIKAYQFSVGDECWVDYHIPHDYVPGTDIYLHFHWSHNSAIVTGGSVTWGADITYAKGHDQAAFPATVNITVVGNASTTQYQHIITEVQISTSGGGANQIDTDNLEPDGVIMIRGYLSANNITSGGAVPDPFLHFKDIHYQSTNIATKNKVPDFYA